jgi:serine/threonine protein kinase
MPEHEVAEIITAVAGALDYARNHDLLHRDVKHQGRIRSAYAPGNTVNSTVPRPPFSADVGWDWRIGCQCR